MRATVQLAEIGAGEVASLRAAVAAPEAFRAAGLNFDPVLAGLRVSLERGGDGSHFLSLSSQQVVASPVLNLMLEVNFSSGPVVNTYTLPIPPRAQETRSRAVPAKRSLAPFTPGTLSAAMRRGNTLANAPKAAREHALLVAQAAAPDAPSLTVKAGLTLAAVTVSAATPFTSGALTRMMRRENNSANVPEGTRKGAFLVAQTAGPGAGRPAVKVGQTLNAVASAATPVAPGTR